MMMDCPRCGFNQPQDRFCANCGLDVEQYIAKPKPLWLRSLQNSNLHLGMIAFFVAFVVGYIVYSRSNFVGKKVDALLRGTPLNSRDSVDQSSEPFSAEQPAYTARRNEAEPDPEAAVAPEDQIAPEPTDAALGEDAPAKSANAAAGADGLGVGAVPEVQKMEVTSYEVSREVLANLILEAEKAGEGSEGRAYFWSQGTKAAEMVKNSARMLALSRTMPLQANAQVSIETPTDPESFGFELSAQITKVTGKEYVVKWQSNLVLTTANSGSSANMAGSATLTPTSMLMLVIEPETRTVAEESMARSGEGPWTIFSSENFRAGQTEWVILVQPR